MSFSGLNYIIHMNYMPRWSNQIVWRASFFSVVGKYSTDTKKKNPHATKMRHTAATKNIYYVTFRNTKDQFSLHDLFNHISFLVSLLQA